MKNPLKSAENTIIRSATNDDSKAIINLVFDIWHYEYHFSVNKEDFPDLKKIETYYAKDTGIFFVAFNDSTLVGTIACNKLNENQWVLKRMFVKHPYRQQGVAQLLLDKLQTDLINGKRNNISLFLSTKENQALAAKQFYLKNGFERIAKKSLPSNFPYFYEDDLFMLKSLDVITRQYVDLTTPKD